MAFRITLWLSLLIPTLVQADGFGWYPMLFDYGKFSKDYTGAIAQQINSRQAADTNSSDGPVFDYLTAHKQRYQFQVPRMYDTQLLGHDGLMEITSLLKGLHPDTPLRFLETGRRFVSPDKLVTCPDDEVNLIHGNCRTYILFTPKEVETTFWQLTELWKKKPKFSELYISQELVRLRNIFKEALLKQYGLYIYGHD